MYLDRTKNEYKRKADAGVYLLLFIITALMAVAAAIAEK